MTARYWINLLGALAILLSPALAMAQETTEEEADKWQYKMPTDRPGFVNSATTLNPGYYGFEIGLNADKPAGTDLGIAMNVLAKMAFFEGFELRAELPNLKYLFQTETTSNTANIQGDMAVDSLNLGTKISFDLNAIFQMAFIPHLVIAAGEITPYAGFGAGVNVIAQINPIGTLVVTGSVTPKILQYKHYETVLVTIDGEETEADEEVEGGASFEMEMGLNVQGALTREFGMFGEVLYVLSGDPEQDSYSGLNAGFNYYITPNVMMDMSAGIFFRETLSAFGGLGVSFQLR